jgi:hypothetical protein
MKGDTTKYRKATLHERPSRENQTGLSLEAGRPSRNKHSNEASRRSAPTRRRPSPSKDLFCQPASNCEPVSSTPSGLRIRLALPFPRKSPQPTTCEVTAPASCSLAGRLLFESMPSQSWTAGFGLAAVASPEGSMKAFRFARQTTSKNSTLLR